MMGTPILQVSKVATVSNRLLGPSARPINKSLWSMNIKVFLFYFIFSSPLCITNNYLSTCSCGRHWCHIHEGVQHKDANQEQRFEGRLRRGRRLSSVVQPW
jgi:hypothetical protein